MSGVPPNYAQRIRVVDSHTAGEPTRVVVAGGPDLGAGPVAERVKRFRRDFDFLRSAVVTEPRGSDALVGALLGEPVDPASAASVIFFNNVGYLGMCGHGTMGLLVTLAHLGRIAPGEHRIDTPVGTISAVLHDSNTVTVRNVASYRTAANVPVHVPEFGAVSGDIAWGGNWFFQINEHSFDLSPRNIDVLTGFAWRVREALRSNGITGDDGAEIDHIELISPSATPGIDAKNFVLCPGRAYDRSPCGTGTSAKLACLYAEGKLREGQVWRQESILGSVFEGSVQICNGRVIPSIRGAAFITAEAELILDPNDPFRHGIPS